MRKTLIGGAGALAVLAGAAPVFAEPGVSVTIYGNNIALVRDIRALNLTSGRQTIEFKNVSAKIRP